MKQQITNDTVLRYEEALKSLLNSFSVMMGKTEENPKETNPDRERFRTNLVNVLQRDDKLYHLCEKYMVYGEEILNKSLAVQLEDRSELLDVTFELGIAFSSIIEYIILVSRKKDDSMTCSLEENYFQRLQHKKEKIEEQEEWLNQKMGQSVSTKKVATSVSMK